MLRAPKSALCTPSSPLSLVTTLHSWPRGEGSRASASGVENARLTQPSGNVGHGGFERVLGFLAGTLEREEPIVEPLGVIHLLQVRNLVQNHLYGKIFRQEQQLAI